MAEYRAHVIDSESAADGTLHFDCRVQRLDDPGPPEVWVLVPGGNRTLVLGAAATLAITESGMTDQEKRTALKALFRQTAEEWGINVSDDAEEQLMALIPSGSWPVDVPLDGI